jgi:hypothetical protein
MMMINTQEEELHELFPLINQVQLPTYLQQVAGEKSEEYNLYTQPHDHNT